MSVKFGNRVTNARVSAAEVSDIISEFAEYISGMKSDKDVSLFTNAKAASINKKLVGNIVSLENVNLDTEEARLLKKALLASDHGSYFMEDAKNLLKGKQNIDSKIFIPDRSKIRKSLGMLDTIGYESVEKTTKQSDGKESKTVGYGLPVPASGSPPEIEHLNTGSPSKFSNPSIAAVEMFDGEFSLPTRGSDQIALFFNCIPPIELSKCAPYIDLTLRYNKDIADLTQDAVLRFEKNSEGSFDNSMFQNTKRRYMTDVENYLKGQSFQHPLHQYQRL